jgi:hypothetical protein
MRGERERKGVRVFAVVLGKGFTHRTQVAIEREGKLSFREVPAVEVARESVGLLAYPQQPHLRTSKRNEITEMEKKIE